MEKIFSANLREIGVFFSPQPTHKKLTFFLLEYVLMSIEYVVILFAISHILFSKKVFYSPIYGKSDKISSLKYRKNDKNFCKSKIINNLFIYKKVVHFHLRLHYAAMGVLSYSVCCNHN